MRAFRWFQIVAVMAAVGLVDRTAGAQVANQTAGAAAAEVAPAPSPTALPPVQGTEACAACPAACAECNCVPVWHAYAEYLLLRPRNEGVEYAVPTNGPIAAGVIPLQVGPTATVDPQFQSGFEIGFERILSECSSISVSYTYYRNDASDGPVTAADPFVLQSMTFNPSSTDAATNFASATAHEATSFNLVDLDYHHNLWSCDCSSINYLVGARYAQLNQQFNADYESIISASVNSSVEFDGMGLRLGVDGERTIGGGFFVTAKAIANLIGGEFSGSYTQGNANSPIVATTSWNEARFISILETEIAIGWQSCDGHVRTSIGYTISDWTNVVKPSDFIASVQANQYVGTNQMGNTSLVFDGLVARLELVW